MIARLAGVVDSAGPDGVVIDVGGALPSSARKAPQMIPFFAVASIRAEPFEKRPPRLLLTLSPTAPPVPKRTVALGPTSRDVALASFAAAPPAGPNTSTPTRIAAPVVLVQAKKVPRLPLRITPGTE